MKLIICHCAQFIAEVQDKDLNYEMVDFHSQRPGHDLRYALQMAAKMKEMGWEPHIQHMKGLETTIKWTLENDRWIKQFRQYSSSTDSSTLLASPNLFLALLLD